MITNRILFVWSTLVGIVLCTVIARSVVALSFVIPVALREDLVTVIIIFTVTMAGYIAIRRIINRSITRPYTTVLNETYPFTCHSKAVPMFLTVCIVLAMLYNSYLLYVKDRPSNDEINQCIETLSMTYNGDNDLFAYVDALDTNSLKTLLLTSDLIEDIAECAESMVKLKESVTVESVEAIASIQSEMDVRMEYIEVLEREHRKTVVDTSLRYLLCGIMMHYVLCYESMHRRCKIDASLV